MLEYVPIKKFQQFLLQHGVIWDGKILKEINGKTKAVDMTTRDYGTFYRGGLSIKAKIPKSIRDYYFCMLVTETKLIFQEQIKNNVFGDMKDSLDLSEEWRDYLIENYIGQYGPIIREYATQEINRISKNANLEIDDLTNKYNEKVYKVKKEAEEKTSKFRKILEKTRNKYSSM